VTAFPRWVPEEVLGRAGRLSVDECVAAFGAELLFKISGVRFAEPAAVDRERRRRPGNRRSA
jgi:hypothetical protein